MGLLFDTSVAISLRDGDPRLLAHQESSGATGIVSVLTMVELEGGVDRTPSESHVRRAAVQAMYETMSVLAFTRREAELYGQIVRQLGFSRSRVIDRMIAATAISAGLKVATLNPRDFRDIPGLELEDWGADADPQA